MATSMFVETLDNSQHLLKLHIELQPAQELVTVFEIRNKSFQVLDLTASR